MDIIKENTIDLEGKISSFNEAYRIITNNDLFDRIQSWIELTSNNSKLLELVTENEVLQDILDSKIQEIKLKRISDEQHYLSKNYTIMWNRISAPLVSIIPSLAHNLGFTLHEAIDGINLPNVGTTIGESIGGMGSGLFTGFINGIQSIIGHFFFIF